MLNIKFLIDKEILAKKMIAKKNFLPTDFANYLWGKYRNSYLEIKRSITSNYIDSKMLIELQEQDFFNIEFEKAKQNLKRIEGNWLKNKDKINYYLRYICRKDFDLNVNAYITSPNLNAGENIGNNTFLWGHKLGLEDLNYDLVYLVHESLHSLFPKDDLSHSIIEKICDVELAKYLNKDYKGYKTHTFTKDYHIKSFPFWNLYLNLSPKDILKEQEDSGIKYNYLNFEELRNKLNNMNIWDFANFLKDEIQNINYTSTYIINN